MICRYRLIKRCPRVCYNEDISAFRGRVAAHRRLPCVQTAEVIALLTIRFLGTYLVSFDKRPVESFSTDKERALLAYLAVEAAQPLRREELATLLWPDLPTGKARNNFRVTLHRLRKALSHSDADVIKATRETVGLNPQVNVQIDVNLLMRKLEKVGKHNHQNRLCHECHVRLTEAADLYRGAFLAGFALDGSPAFNDWVRRKREWLHLRLLDALDKLATYHQRRGQLEPAQEYAYRQIEMEPWRESAHRQLMRSLACAGNYNTALVQFDKCRETLSEELDVKPTGETVRLYEAIMAARETHFRALPVAPGPLIGRDEALTDIVEQLADPACRLLTLVGPGGVGKSRLALELAQRLSAAFLHGVCYVPLSSVDSIEGLFDAIARAAQYPYQDGRDPRAELLDYLANKEMLLVLDNFEQLVNERELLSQLLSSAPELKLLVTSRVRLNLNDETTVELQGLAVPEHDGTQNIEQYGAVKLFMEKAKEAHPQFELSPEARASVLQLCRFLSGMPLSIELAASWSRLLTPQETLDRIRQNPDFLESPASDAPDRHRSMRASFEHSWALLEGQEQDALMTLSISRGGLTVEAAKEITGASLHTLSSLVDHSLLWHDVSAERLDMHELLRQFAGDKLTQANKVDAERRSHSAYYIDLLCRLGEDVNGGEQQLAALETIDADIDNIRLAWHWAIENQTYDRLQEAVAVLAQAFRYSSRAEEGERLFRQAADLLRSRTDEDSVRLRGQIMARQADFARELLRYDEAFHLLERSLQTARRAKAQAEIAFCLRVRGRCLFELGKVGQAKPVLEESLEIAAATGARQTQIRALIGLHGIAILEGQLNRAAHLARRQLALCQQTGDKFSLYIVIFRLGANNVFRGDYEEGRRYLEESLTLGRQLDDPARISESQGALALYATRIEGAYEEARALAEKSLALARSINDPGCTTRALVALGDVACWHERYDEALRRAEESLQITATRGESELIHLGRNVLSLALCGLGAYEDAKSEICKALRLTGLHTPEFILLSHLAGMALLLTHEEDYERVIELYALTASYHAHPPAWQTKLPIHVNARNELRAKVPPDIFSRAWKRGEERDLEDALKSVLSKYCF